MAIAKNTCKSLRTRRGTAGCTDGDRSRASCCKTRVRVYAAPEPHARSK
jgi:hypothetical protein